MLYFCLKNVTMYFRLFRLIDFCASCLRLSPLLSSKVIRTHNAMDPDNEAVRPDEDSNAPSDSAVDEVLNLEMVKVEVLLTEGQDGHALSKPPVGSRVLQEVMPHSEPTNGSPGKASRADGLYEKALAQTSSQEQLIEGLEPCIEFHTIKVEPLDCMYRSDSNSWDGCDFPSAPLPPPAAEVPEPGFSMTVPLKALKVKTKPKKRKEEFHCEFCKKKYVIKSRLIKHINDHLGVKADKVIKCEVCNKLFDYPHQLNKHSAKHSMERRFPCFECGQSFRYYANLQVHLKRHTVIHEVCDECGKVFNSHGGVFRHKKRMHRELPEAERRPFSCEQCRARFRNKRNLTVHLRTHTGVRPYACQFCEKTFFDTSTLNRHVRIHTGLKPYQCELCEKCFTDGGSLTFHVRKHHTGERPHRCPHCSTAYHHHSNLKRHLRTHLHSDGGLKKPKVKKEKPTNAKPKRKRGRKPVVKEERDD